MECGRNRNDCFQDYASKDNITLNKYYKGKFSKMTGTEIQSQHLGVNRQLSMEGIAVKYFLNSINPGGK